MVEGFSNRKVKPAEITKSIEITLEAAYQGVNYPIEIERYILDNNMKRFEKETVYIDIPRGIDTNEIIKIENKGNINSDGLQGDVKIYVTVKNEMDVERLGLNLIYKKTISLKEALTGFSFELKHLNGKKYSINNSSIIKPGYESVINNMGMIRGEKMGNLIIKFDVDFPKNLSDEQKEKLKNIL